MEIRSGDLADVRVVALLEHHAATAREQTARGSAHALDLAAFRSPDLSLWAVWEDNELLGIGALKRLSPTLAEVKAMHTTQAARRRGVGGRVLRHLITVSRAEGLSRLSLETGSWPYFEPAQAFYQSHGFVECPPFGDYGPDPNSVFMTLDLQVTSLTDAGRQGVRSPRARPGEGEDQRAARFSALQRLSRAGCDRGGSGRNGFDHPEAHQEKRREGEGE